MRFKARACGVGSNPIPRRARFALFETHIVHISCIEKRGDRVIPRKNSETDIT
jgi:hypothetical protein